MSTRPLRRRLRVRPGPLGLALHLLLAAAALAQVPRHFGVALRLEDPLGKPRSGVVTLGLDLRDHPTLGPPLRSETDLVTLGEGGLAVSSFGDQADLPPGALGGGHWLQAHVDGVPLDPALPLHVQPLALRAHRAATTADRRAVLEHSGDDLESGDRLWAAVQPNFSTTSRPYALYLGPGRYDLGAKTLPVDAHLQLVGAGPARTVIARSGGTVVAPDEGARIADLRIEGDTLGLDAGDAAGLRLERVEVALTGAPGTAPVGVRAGGGSLHLVDCRVRVEDTDAQGGTGVLLEPAGTGAHRLTGTRVELASDATSGLQAALRVSGASATPQLLEDSDLLSEVSALAAAVGASVEASATLDLHASRATAVSITNPRGLATATGGAVRAHLSLLSGSVAGVEVCGRDNFDERLRAQATPACP